MGAEATAKGAGSFPGDEDILELDMVPNSVDMLITIEFMHFKRVNSVICSLYLNIF